MMETKYILIQDYCSISNIEPDFIHALAAENMIILKTISGEQYLEEDQIEDLEQYIRLHYDMEINIEGIDAIRHLLSRIKKMQIEIRTLHERLKLYE